MPMAAAVTNSSMAAWMAREGPLRGCTCSTFATVPCSLSLERKNLIENLLAIGRLLDLGYAAAPAIGDARFGDAFVGDRVSAPISAGRTIAGDGQHPEFGVDAHFLRTPDHQIAVRQDIGDDGGYVELQRFRTLDLPVRGGVRGELRVPAPLPAVLSLSHCALMSKPSLRLAVRLLSFWFLKLARSLILMLTVRMSPCDSARGSVNSRLWRSSHSENFFGAAGGVSGYL